MRKKLILCLIFILVQALLLSGCGFSTKALSKAGYNTESITIQLEGVTKPVNILLLADLHLIADTDEVDAAELETVIARRDTLFYDSAKLWDDIPSLLNKCNADYLLFAGDMVDFNSGANTSLLKEGLDKLQTPFIYVRGDHDSQPYYLSDKDANAARDRQDSLYQNGGAYYVEFDEFVILGLNNSTDQVTEEALKTAKEAYAIGKPIILLTHVPIDSYLDDSLRTASAQAKNGRFLLWSSSGECYYYPNAVTSEFLSMVYAEDSLIKEVLCGHLHINWDGYITENTHEHVFYPAFIKNVGVITVTGK